MMYSADRFLKIPANDVFYYIIQHHCIFSSYFIQNVCRSVLIVDVQVVVCAPPRSAHRTLVFRVRVSFMVIKQVILHYNIANW